MKLISFDCNKKNMSRNFIGLIYSKKVFICYVYFSDSFELISIK